MFPRLAEQGHKRTVLGRDCTLATLARIAWSFFDSDFKVEHYRERLSVDASNLHTTERMLAARVIQYTSDSCEIAFVDERKVTSRACRKSLGERGDRLNGPPRTFYTLALTLDLALGCTLSAWLDQSFA